MKLFPLVVFCWRSTLNLLVCISWFSWVLLQNKELSFKGPWETIIHLKNKLLPSCITILHSNCKVSTIFCKVTTNAMIRISAISGHLHPGNLSSMHVEHQGTNWNFGWQKVGPIWIVHPHLQTMNLSFPHMCVESWGHIQLLILLTKWQLIYDEPQKDDMSLTLLLLLTPAPFAGFCVTQSLSGQMF